MSHSVCKIQYNNSILHIDCQLTDVQQSVWKGYKKLDVDCVADLHLYEQTTGLALVWYPQLENGPPASKPIKFKLDFVEALQRVRSLPAPKQGALNQAIGKRTKRVIDATGGWGNDAMLLAMQGYQVTIFEREPLMGILLMEAFGRLKNYVSAESVQLKIPEVHIGDATEFLSISHFPADCVYLDPMFPPKRKKSAAASKYMQLLQQLLGQDSGAEHLVPCFLRMGYPRIVVKRPDHARALHEPFNEQFSSKLVHYDVYLQT